MSALGRLRTLFCGGYNLTAGRTNMIKLRSSPETNIGFRLSAIHGTSANLVKDDRRIWQKSMTRLEEGADGERSFDLDGKLRDYSMFPDENTPDLLFNGVRFADLAVAYIKCSKNNTIFMLTDSKGKAICNHSTHMEGFRHARKKTTIAAQAAAISFGRKIEEANLKTIRVVIRGLGPGRLSSIKGMQMAGVNIISITDNTPAEVNCPRPRKARRI